MSGVGGDATRQIVHINPLSVDEILAEVTGIIARYLPDARIFLFGSRAKGCAGETSNFDIAIDAGSKISGTIENSSEIIISLSFTAEYAENA
ncbi:MAG: nucleotidyltransferase domain-containing protein, partial [Euryarchaeota archaeon]|nr:nucleotidyltransferase domain-containing protein [Euryarchaeota archaeon]